MRVIFMALTFTGALPRNASSLSDTLILGLLDLVVCASLRTVFLGTVAMAVAVGRIAGENSGIGTVKFIEGDILAVDLKRGLADHGG